MPGPTQHDEALRWVREAVQAGRTVLSRHFRLDRLEQRGLTMDDLHYAIEQATGIEPYERRSPVNGGTCWRVLGPSLDAEELAIGVETFLDKKRRRVVICTIFVVKGASDEL